MKNENGGKSKIDRFPKILSFTTRNTASLKDVTSKSHQ